LKTKWQLVELDKTFFKRDSLNKSKSLENRLCPSLLQKKQIKQAFKLCRPNHQGTVEIKNIKMFFMVLLGVRSKQEIERSFSRFEQSFQSNLPSNPKRSGVFSASPHTKRRSSSPATVGPFALSQHKTRQESLQLR
jgi:lipid A disaccharide synthetase